jgi:hypothetical protein
MEEQELVFFEIGGDVQGNRGIPLYFAQKGGVNWQPGLAGNPHLKSKLQRQLKRKCHEIS